MNVWDWIEIAWLGGLSLLAAMVIPVQNTIGRLGDRSRERVRDLEKEIAQLRELLGRWADRG